MEQGASGARRQTAAEKPSQFALETAQFGDLVLDRLEPPPRRRANRLAETRAFFELAPQLGDVGKTEAHLLCDL